MGVAVESELLHPGAFGGPWSSLLLLSSCLCFSASQRMLWNSRSTVESEGEIASTVGQASYLVLCSVAACAWCLVASIHSRVKSLCWTLFQSCSRDRRPDIEEPDVIGILTTWLQWWLYPWFIDALLLSQPPLDNCNWNWKFDWIRSLAWIDKFPVNWFPVSMARLILPGSQVMAGSALHRILEGES